MFDSITVQPSFGPSHVTHSHHEHRAPTDDSIRLFKELEQKAKDSVLGAVRVIDTHFDGVIYHQRDHLNGQTNFIVAYSLNGKKLKTEHSIDDFHELKIEDVFRQLVDKVAVDIAVQILAKPFTEATRFWKP